LTKKIGASLCGLALIFLCSCSNSGSPSVPAVAAGNRLSTTGNPQVALYSISPSKDASVHVEFGTDTTYGRSTSPQTTPTGGGAVNILVAGMLGLTKYHMRAVVDFTDGTQFLDDDQTFTTGAVPTGHLPGLTATTSAGGTPQPGVEMLDLIGSQPGVLAIDLSGNIIWTYSFTGGTAADLVQPIKLLPNGHFLVQISPTSSFPVTNNPPAGTIITAREVDLAGNTIHELTLDTLNSRLNTTGIPFSILDLHHDILALPNGHWIILGNITKQIQGLGNVLGDVLVDVDENMMPVWTWSTFDHLDVNRHPLGLPDWTHANAVVYSKDDGNLLLSMRHQHWLIKIDYNNGTGAGDIMWRLGTGGDFTLAGGTDPSDWFYAQHGPAFVSANTTGQFSMVLFDNGNNRIYPPADPCTTAPTPSCNYSSAPIIQIDENAHTATIGFHDKPLTFSIFGGNAEVLANGNIEYDICGITLPPSGNSTVSEVTDEASPRTVWHLAIAGANAYRAFRLPSLYPGVQW
jgi:arylsulfate sulfotransferase